ncbi:MAG: hypothetical protein JXP34_06080 [Planctomycetes bacterium]|nr:hypothetical protein [Planctomycetota bacterium]
MRANQRLASYIAPGAPATRRPAAGDEPFLRPEIGFTPSWYRRHLGIDFGERWHTDPARRLEAGLAARAELRRRFPDLAIGRLPPQDPLDLLTGAFGACVIPGIFGVRIRFAPGEWPACERPPCKRGCLDDGAADSLAPPDLDANPFFERLIAQLAWIRRAEGRVAGFLNWQGVLNNAYRLRGEDLFLDIASAPDRARHIFRCVTDTMIEAMRRVHALQTASGFEVRHATISNCLVNTISARDYEDLLLPFDRRIAEAFGSIGIHNCAWDADPYLAAYATIPGVGYIDMGIETDLAAARALFPDARRAVMYTPMDLARKSMPEIEADLARIARDLGPCDLVLADIDAGTPDERVRDAAAACARISDAADRGAR